MDNLYDQYDIDSESSNGHEPISISSDKALATERRRKAEDKLEMLRLKRELGLDEDFTF